MIVIKNEKFKKKKITIIPNQIEDRANILLINCSINSIINLGENKSINLKNIFLTVNVFSSLINSFQVCFHNDNLEDYSFRKIQEIETLNFNEKYSKYNEKVNNIYNTLFDEIKKKNPKIKDIFSDLYDKEKIELENIIFRKFNFGKKILEDDLDEEYYIDFKFKIIFFMYIDYSINPKKDFDITDIMNIFNKLDKNKNKICNDNSLKNYEKIILLIELYSSKILLKEDGIINYLHLNNIDKFSPLYYAYDFLIDFITKLDNKSNFYYPILLIDSGKFCYNLKKNNDGKLISTFGFNML